MTIADQFLQTFVYQPDNRRAFINISMIMHPDMKFIRENPKLYIFQEGVVHDEIIDIDGFPHVQTRLKFLRAIKNCGDNDARVFILLNQVFRKDFIKLAFKDVYFAWHKVGVRKAAKTSFDEYRRKLKRTSKSDLELHREAVRVTQGMSIKEAARRSVV